jgi:hypothetical protein
MRSFSMELSEMLKRAWAAVEDAELPDKIHEVAFREAMRVIAPLPVAPVLPAQRAAKPGGGGVAGDSGGGGSNGDDGVSVTEDEILDKVADGTGVDRHKLAEVVHLDGDVVKVSIPGIKLGKNNAEKTRVVAQILTVVRGFGLDEAETPVDAVRAEAIRLRCYDSPNFAAHLGKLKGYVITGSGTNRRLRVKPAGIEAFPVLVDSLLGAS